MACKRILYPAIRIQPNASIWNCPSVAQRLYTWVRHIGVICGQAGDAPFFCKVGGWIWWQDRENHSEESLDILILGKSTYGSWASEIDSLTLCFLHGSFGKPSNGIPTWNHCCKDLCRVPPLVHLVIEPFLFSEHLILKNQCFLEYSLGNDPLEVHLISTDSPVR